MLKIVNQAQKSWIGIHVDVPLAIRMEACDRVKTELQYGNIQACAEHSTIGEAIVTLCYGFDSDKYPEANRLVQAAALTDSDIRFGPVYALSLNYRNAKDLVIASDVLVNDKLSSLCKSLNALLPASANKIRIPLHVTLCVLRSS